MDVDDPKGFAAMGEQVPLDRKIQALDHLREMNPNLDSSREVLVIDRVSNAIEKDRPYEAVTEARKELDVTGAYRLLAAICTGGDDSGRRI